MATPGFGGKILFVNLSTKEIRALDSQKYEMYGGVRHGHGPLLGVLRGAGDWDMQDAFHPNISP